MWLGYLRQDRWEAIETEVWIVDRPRSDGPGGFFGVAARPRSYLNLLYLLLGLPLGSLYFTVLVTGFSLSVGLMIVALIGIPIVIGLWYVVHAFMRFERTLAVGMLGELIPPVARVPEWPGGLWTHFKNLVGNRPTWRGIVYLFLRFPVGVATFTIAVTLVAVSVGLAFGPTYAWASDNVTWGSVTFDPFPWSFLLVPVGFFLIFVSLHVMNAIAKASGRWARWALGRPVEDLPSPSINVMSTSSR